MPISFDFAHGYETNPYDLERNIYYFKTLAALSGSDKDESRGAYGLAMRVADLIHITDGKAPNVVFLMHRKLYTLPGATGMVLDLKFVLNGIWYLGRLTEVDARFNFTSGKRGTINKGFFPVMIKRLENAPPLPAPSRTLSLNPIALADKFQNHVTRNRFRFVRPLADTAPGQVFAARLSQDIEALPGVGDDAGDDYGPSPALQESEYGPTPVTRP